MMRTLLGRDGDGGGMTQVVRQKWVLVVASVNALLALAVMAVVALALSAERRSAQDAALRSEAELREVRGELERLHGLPAAIEQLRFDELHRAAAPPADAQLTQTLQLVASEQQLLLLRAIQPPPVAPAPRRVQQRSARRARPRRQAACAVTK